jgi:hypothetical protein
MSFRPMSARAVQVAVVLEVLWAAFLAYEVHWNDDGGLLIHFFAAEA